MSSSKVTRRDVLRGSTAVAAASTLGPFFPARVLGANDRMNVAIVGLHGQGAEHVRQFLKLPGVEIKTLCDIDAHVFASRLETITKAGRAAPSTAADLRRVFDDKEVDAVSFATPNHWHALGTIWACQAGKHVYVEKPACHTAWEGRQMVHAARKHGVVVQVGFQNRSRKNTRAAIDLITQGKIGKVFRARGLCFKPRGSIGRYPDGPMPDGAAPLPVNTAYGAYTKGYLATVNYDLWTGPAQKRPFNPNRFHYNWHWFWDYGNGDTGNQGPHQFDVARWGLGKDDHPVRVRSYGGYFVHDSAQETPNEQTSVFEYADGTILELATRGLLTNAEGGLKIGAVFYGSEGRLEIDAEGQWKTFMGPKDEPGPSSAAPVPGEASNALVLTGGGMTGHFENFAEAVRARNPELLTCDVEVGYRSSMLPILANASYRLKRELKFDGRTEQFVGDAEANRLLRRTDRAGFVVPKLGAVGLRA